MVIIALNMPPTPYYILIVEDDRPIAAFVQTILEGEGFLTGVVHHGNHVMESVASRRPDLVLLDWMLPGKDGQQMNGLPGAISRPGSFSRFGRRMPMLHS